MMRLKTNRLLPPICGSICGSIVALWTGMAQAEGLSALLSAEPVSDGAAYSMAMDRVFDPRFSAFCVNPDAAGACELIFSLEDARSTLTTDVVLFRAGDRGGLFARIRDSIAGPSQMACFTLGSPQDSMDVRGIAPSRTYGDRGAARPMDADTMAQVFEVFASTRTAMAGKVSCLSAAVRGEAGGVQVLDVIYYLDGVQSEAGFTMAAYAEKEAATLALLVLADANAPEAPTKTSDEATPARAIVVSKAKDTPDVLAVSVDTVVAASVATSIGSPDPVGVVPAAPVQTETATTATAEARATATSSASATAAIQFVDMFTKPIDPASIEAYEGRWYYPGGVEGFIKWAPLIVTFVHLGDGDYSVKFENKGKTEMEVLGKHKKGRVLVSIPLQESFATIGENGVMELTHMKLLKLAPGTNAHAFTMDQQEQIRAALKN